jgi:hypothetical protein
MLSCIQGKMRVLDGPFHISDKLGCCWGLPEGSHPQPQRKTSFRPLIGNYAQLEHIRPNNPLNSIQCCRPNWHFPDSWENALCQWFYQFGNLWVLWSHSVVE